MHLRAIAALPLMPCALGCAGNVAGPTGSAEAGTTTSAVVVVERSIDVGQGVQAEVSARFVRAASGVSGGDALRVIGAALDLPAPGACADAASLAGGLTSGQPAPVVELLDVGDVSVKTDGVEMRLLPRQLPDVTDVVSGIVYARAAEPSLLPASAAYAVHVAGGRDLGAFDISAPAPDDPSTVRIAGEDSAGELVASGTAVELTWDTGADGDAVYVDVRPNGVRCFLGDGGHGSVSTLFFDDSGTLVVHRLRRQTLRAPGVDSGELRFDFARSVAYVRH